MANARRRPNELFSRRLYAFVDFLIFRIVLAKQSSQLVNVKFCTAFAQRRAILSFFLLLLNECFIPVNATLFFVPNMFITTCKFNVYKHKIVVIMMKRFLSIMKQFYSVFIAVNKSQESCFVNKILNQHCGVKTSLVLIPSIINHACFTFLQFL